jgi:hypothetical protein
MPSAMQAAMPSRIQVIGGAIQVIAGFFLRIRYETYRVYSNVARAGYAWKVRSAHSEM